MTQTQLYKQNELKEILKKIMTGEEVEKKDMYSYEYNDIVGLKYMSVILDATIPITP